MFEVVYTLLVTFNYCLTFLQYVLLSDRRIALNIPNNRLKPSQTLHPLLIFTLVEMNFALDFVFSIQK